MDYMLYEKKPKARKNKVMKFLSALDDYGEDYISNGSIKKDYDFITSVLLAQGYWAGCRFRLYFDSDLNLIRAEERFLG